MVPALLREPLVHFLLLGAAVFGLHAALGGRAMVERPGTVVVDAGVRARLAADHERREGAPPTEAELRAAADAWVEGEVLRREARALGLDRGDLVVERRLAQKMGFLLRSEADPPAPTDADLQAVLDATPGAFAAPGRLRFEHRMFRTRQEAEAAVGTDDPGEPFIHGRSIDDDAAGVDGRFGPGFAAALDDAPTGRWAGPVRSRFGHHVVRLERRAAAAAGTVETHREALTRRWTEQRRDALQRERTAALVARYEVREAP